MKKIITTVSSFIIITAFSCKTATTEELLIGKRSSDNVVNTTNIPFSDKITFYNSASFTIELFANDTLYSRVLCKYKLTGNTFLTTSCENSGNTKFEIIKIDYKTLELKPVGQNLINRYKKSNY